MTLCISFYLTILKKKRQKLVTIGSQDKKRSRPGWNSPSLNAFIDLLLRPTNSDTEEKKYGVPAYLVSRWEVHKSRMRDTQSHVRVCATPRSTYESSNYPLIYPVRHNPLFRFRGVHRTASVGAASDSGVGDEKYYYARQDSRT